MRARLFFDVLAKGRLIEHRRKYRNFYELTRVAAYPTYTKASQQEYQQFLWDSSVTPTETQMQEEFRNEVEQVAKSQEKYLPSAAVLTFFRGRARH